MAKKKGLSLRDGIAVLGGWLLRCFCVLRGGFRKSLGEEFVQDAVALCDAWSVERECAACIPWMA